MSNRPTERAAGRPGNGELPWLAICLQAACFAEAACSAVIVCLLAAVAACAPPPVDQSATEAPPGRTPPGAGKASFTIAYTGADQGILEPCGCTEGMHGGIGRRASFLEAVLPSGCRGVILACGGLMKAGKATPLQILRYETLLVALNEMEYAAAAIGPEELGLGLGRLHAAAEIVDFPFVLTNVDFPGMSDALPFLRSHGLTVEGDWDRAGSAAVEPKAAAPRLAVFAVIAPSCGDELPAGAVLQDPAAAIERESGPAGDRDFTVILMRGNREEARELGSRIAEPRLIVYAPIGAEPRVYEFGRSEGDATIVTPGDRGRFVGLSTVASAKEGWSVKESRFEALDESIPPSEKAAFPLNIYRERIRLEGILDRMLETKPAPPGGDYVGSEACRECHPKTFEVLKGSAHFKAFETLRRVDRAFDPGCISCHVVGFGFTGGFLGAEKSPHLLGVGCEACHGPCGDHAAGGPPPENTASCAICHDDYHSPGFLRAEAWKKIACIREN